MQLSRINSNVELRDIWLCLKHTEETLLSAFLANYYSDDHIKSEIICAYCNYG